MRTVVLGLVAVLVACGGSEPPSGSAGAGGNAGSSGLPAGGAPSGGAGGAPSGGAGSGGAGSGGAAACSDFVSAATVFQAENDVPGALAVTADDLELFHSSGEQFVVRTRTAKTDVFSEPAPVFTYAALCPSVDPTLINPSIDISGDGLRVYFTCIDEEGPLGLAERPDRASAFVIAPDSIGNAGASISISADELTVYSATTNGVGSLLLRSERASTSEDFGPAVRVEEIASEFRHPEISADGLSLFGLGPGEPTAGGQDTWFLVVATRQTAGGTFSQPTTAGLPAQAADASDYSPSVSGDCSSLYFLRLANMGTYAATVNVASR